MVSRLLSIVAICMLAGSQAGCLKYEEVSLPHGFKIVYLDGENRVMLDPSEHEFVIFPKITSFKVVGDKVVGMRERPKLIIKEDDPAFTTGFGPFCVILKEDGTFTRCDDRP